jgi:hypothetical protein
VTSTIFEQENPMKKIVFAAALLMISASAQAGTYSVDGITVHVQDGCRSSSCVSVYAPDYGYYHEGRSVKVHKAQKDTARVASAKKEDAAVPAPAAAAPAAEATPAKTPEAAPQAAPSDAAPTK